MSFYTLSVVHMCLIVLIGLVNVLLHVNGANVEPMQVGDISKRKCSETYKGLFSSSIKRKRNLQSSGIDAEPEEFPHVALLGYGDKENKTWVCGGTLISNKYILTVAHCANTPRGQVKHVRLGELDLKSTADETKTQDFEVAKVIVHPRYQENIVYHDIALLELATKVEINDFVRPACLYTEDSLPDGEWSVAGWGLRNFIHQPTNRLRKLKFSPVTEEECRSTYSNSGRNRLNGVDFETQTCAREDVKDSCQADSGTSLQIKNSEFDLGYKVFGVTSFGLSCGSGTAPIIFTRVSHYIEWIESIVWPQ